VGNREGSEWETGGVRKGMGKRKGRGEGKGRTPNV